VLEEFELGADPAPTLPHHMVVLTVRGILKKKKLVTLIFVQVLDYFSFF